MDDGEIASHYSRGTLLSRLNAAIGSGIGGPARYFARRFGCQVTGIDLTAEFCEVARHLTRLLGMEDRVRFEPGDALAMPFADASFDGAYSMNVSMNIAGKGAFYREVRRVLKPGAWLLLSEVTKGRGGERTRSTARAPWWSAARSRRIAPSRSSTASSRPRRRRTPPAA
ncbi:MAG: class I SAM-dependent methyltransferase [Betaproteobacteria bacterium]